MLDDGGCIDKNDVMICINDNTLTDIQFENYKNRIIKAFQKFCLKKAVSKGN